jgi:hypothetical protein
MRKCRSTNINDFVNSNDDRKKFTYSILKFIENDYDIRNIEDNASLVSFTPQGLILSSVVADSLSREIYFFYGDKFYIIGRENLKSDIYPIEEKFNYLSGIETIVSTTPLSIPYAISFANSKKLNYMHYDEKIKKYNNPFFINMGISGENFNSNGHEDPYFGNAQVRVLDNSTDNRNIVIIEFNSQDIDDDKLNIKVDIKGKFALCGNKNYKHVILKD